MYCIVAKKRVYSCDHFRCNDNKESNPSNGMKWCIKAKKYVYACDHYDCNKK